MRKTAFQKSFNETRTGSFVIRHDAKFIARFHPHLNQSRSNRVTAKRIEIINGNEYRYTARNIEYVRVNGEFWRTSDLDFDQLWIVAQNEIDSIDQTEIDYPDFKLSLHCVSNIVQPIAI